MSTLPITFKVLSKEDLEDPNLLNLNEKFRQIFLSLQQLQQAPVDPATSKLVSAGSRPQSLASAITFVANSNGSVTFYWDGTNGSSPLKIYRDDTTVEGPFFGKYAVFGLTPGKTYFFYPFFQETVAPATNVGQEPNGVQWASNGAAVGKPPVAFEAKNVLAAQQQLTRDHVPLAVALATDGVLIPNAGTTPGTGGAGGGGAGGGSGGYLD